jgi:uncharacterized DUF497 family protein
MPPTYEWDPAKRLSNIAKHAGIDFVSVRDFEWSAAQTVRNDRGGEVRYSSIGYIGPRLHVVIYTVRDGARRIISLRKANKREEASYATAQTGPYQSDG